MRVRRLITGIFLSLASVSCLGAGQIIFCINTTDCSELLTPAGGTVSYAGGLSPLVGSNLTVPTYGYSNGSVGIFACDDCWIDFISGPLLGVFNDGSGIVGWLFAAAGSSLTAKKGGTDLVQAHFVSGGGGAFPLPLEAGVALFLDEAAGPMWALVGVLAATYTDPALESQVGPAGLGELFLIGGGLNFGDGGSFSSAEPPYYFAAFETVPEPATAVLAGLALLGLGWSARRRRPALRKKH